MADNPQTLKQQRILSMLNQFHPFVRRLATRTDADISLFEDIRFEEGVAFAVLLARHWAGAYLKRDVNALSASEITPFIKPASLLLAPSLDGVGFIEPEDDDSRRKPSEIVRLAHTLSAITSQFMVDDEKLAAMPVDNSRLAAWLEASAKLSDPVIRYHSIEADQGYTLNFLLKCVRDLVHKNAPYISQVANLDDVPDTIYYQLVITAADILSVIYVRVLTQIISDAKSFTSDAEERTRVISEADPETVIKAAFHAWSTMWLGAAVSFAHSDGEAAAE